MVHAAICAEKAQVLVFSPMHGELILCYVKLLSKYIWIHTQLLAYLNRHKERIEESIRYTCIRSTFAYVRGRIHI